MIEEILNQPILWTWLYQATYRQVLFCGPCQWLCEGWTAEYKAFQTAVLVNYCLI